MLVLGVCGEGGGDAVQLEGPCVVVKALAGLEWVGGRGDEEEEGCIHCLLMRPFDVAPLLAVCTPGPLRLHSHWLSAGGGGDLAYPR